MARATGLRSVEPQTEHHPAVYQWHNSVHRRIGVERLYFALLTYPDGFDRDEIIAALAGYLDELEVRSFVIWELFGDRDILLRAWLPPRIDSGTLRDSLRKQSIEVEIHAVDAVVKHWLWNQPSVEIGSLFQSLSIDALWDINDPKLPTQSLETYVSQGILSSVYTGPTSVKFFILVRRQQELKEAQEQAFRKKLESVAMDAPTLQYWSLYSVHGPDSSRYVLSGRVKPELFEGITREINAAINSQAGGALLGSRTRTYVATESIPRLRKESLAPFGVGDSRAPEEAKSASSSASDISPIESLLHHAEGTILEVKGTAFLDIKRLFATGESQPGEKVVQSIVKTVCAFLNTSGGTLIIGAIEEAEFYQFLEAVTLHYGEVPRAGKYLILGVESEYPAKGFDGYQNAIRDALTHRTDPQGIAQSRIQISHVDYQEKSLCVVAVEESNLPIYAIEDKGTYHRYYVRQGNRTIELRGTEKDTYQRQRVAKGSLGE